MRLYPLPPAEPASTTRTYPSSLSDAEWGVLQPLVQHPATPGRKHPLRVVIDAIRYLVRTGCAWRLLPGDFPPPGTVYWWFAKWAADGTLERIHDGCASGSVWQPVAEQRRRRRSSTPSRSARPIPCHGPAAAGTPARRSTAASGTWQWTPQGCCRPCWSLRPACRTATPAGRYCGACAPATGASGWSGPMVATPASWSRGRRACCTWRWRSCGSTLASRPLRCWPAGGWWSGRLPGSASIAAVSATTSACPLIMPRWSPGPWSP